MDNKLACPECKSTNLIKNGWRAINRERVQQYQCKDCWRVTIHPIELAPRDKRGRFTSIKALTGLESNPSASGKKKE